MDYNKILNYLIAVFITGTLLKAIGTDAFTSIFEGFNKLSTLADANGNVYTGVALFSIIPILIVVSAFKYFSDNT